MVPEASDPAFENLRALVQTVGAEAIFLLDAIRAAPPVQASG